VSFSSGYISAILVGWVIFIIINSGSGLYQSNSNPNIIDVNVLGKMYTIDQSRLSVMDNARTEGVIEIYAGISNIHSSESLQYILSQRYSGDKEKAIKLSAKVLLSNLKAYEKKLNKALHLLQNEKLPTGAAVNIAVNYMIYELSPLEHQQRSLESILAGDYQNGINYFIDDAVNRKASHVLGLKMADEKKQEVTGSLGNYLFRDVVKSLVRNDLAKIDYSKVDVKHQETLKIMLKDNSELMIENPPSNDEIESWYEIFQINTAK
jgi:hypothetical protein